MIQPAIAAPLLAVFSPGLAAAAAVTAVGLPVLVHLLFRKRYQIVPWAAIRFLVVAERRHRRRIDQWLLLILRALCLLLPLLAMAAATPWAEPLWQAIKPGAPETNSNTPRTHHVLVVDASLSMTATTREGETRFQQAIGRAKKLVSDANPGDGFSLVVLNGAPRVVITGPANDPRKVLAELDALRVSHAAVDPVAVLNPIADILARSPRAYPRRQVTFLTDLQGPFWPAALRRSDKAPRGEASASDLPEAWSRILARADVVVLDATRVDGDEDPVDNVAIVDLTLADPVPLAGVRAEATASVVNYGRAERIVDVEFSVARVRPDGSSASTLPVRKPLKIPPGGRATVAAELDGPYGFQAPGPHVVQARIVQPDRLPIDDVRFVAADVRDGLHVIVIDPLRIGPESLGLTRALTPPGAGQTLTPVRLRILTPSQFADIPPADLAGTDCVFLNDVPGMSESLVTRLDAVLKRGGGVVVGLGPASATAESRRAYNLLMFRGGKGLLPRPLGELVAAPAEEAGYLFHPDDGDDAFRKPPLAEFRLGNAEAALAKIPFRHYVRLVQPGEERLDEEKTDREAGGTPPPDGGAHRLLSFVRSGGGAARSDPAVLDWVRHRGRVVLFTGTFRLDESWTEWPKLPTYLPFVDNVLRFVIANPDRHTTRVGEALEEYFPPQLAGKDDKGNMREAQVSVRVAGDPPGTEPQDLGSVPIPLKEDVGVALFRDTRVSGIYHVGTEGARGRVFAVNVPESAGTGVAESDLRRERPDLLRESDRIQVLTDPADVKPGGDPNSSLTVTTPKPHGPLIARILVMAAVVVLGFELYLAWRLGPGRLAGAGSAAGSIRPPVGRWYLRLLGSTAAMVPLTVALLLLFSVLHADVTNQPLGFLPGHVRQAAETQAGVPTADAGESTKWRLEGFTAFVRSWTLDRRILLALAIWSTVFTVYMYAREGRSVPGRAISIPLSWLTGVAGSAVRLPLRLVLPACLRMTAFLLLLYVVLPQLRVAFDREGWPDVVILLDTSASMSTVDDLKDPTVRARAEELLRGANLSEANRLKLIQLLLTHPDRDWLDKLVREKNVRVHIYAVDARTRAVTVLSEPADVESGRAAIRALEPVGDESRLGEGLLQVLSAFRGMSLAGVVMFTDGVNTGGDDLPRAAREAYRSGVPLFLVGAGDARETPDLGLADWQGEDSVIRGDRLVIAARLTARGAVPPDPVPVVLYERQPDGRLVKQTSVEVVPDPVGRTRDFQITYTPSEVGRKTLVLEVPAAPGETDSSNNRLERPITVDEARRARVLYIEGRPRYDFRFVKVLLERETEQGGNKSVEVKVLLLGATGGWPETDRSALTDFPTRSQLFEYDAIILGDVDPRQFPSPERNALDLADCVRVKGRGLLVLAGEHTGPAAYAGTPLADVLPIVPAEGGSKPTIEDQPLGDEARYSPRLTPAGEAHPLFRFHPDPRRSAEIWKQLQPLYWYARGYRRKPAAEVLAVHPSRPAEGANGVGPAERHPLVLQQFVGAGRVIYLGFDDTWRWRWRNDEEHFNRFWLQAVRTLARTRVVRTELKLDRPTPYTADDRIVVTVRFPDDAPPPPANTVVRVKLQRSPLPNPDGTAGSGETTTEFLDLARIASGDEGPGAAERSRAFRAVLTRTPPGTYEFSLAEPVVPGGQPTVRTQVLPAPKEGDRVDIDRRGLAAAAGRAAGSEKDGEYYTLADAERVFDELKDLQRVQLPEAAPPLPIWNHPVTYLLFVLLLTSEWLLRKRERLL